MPRVHYFVTTPLDWVCDEDLGIALTRIWDLADSQNVFSKQAVIWRVPGPVETKYRISNYRPIIPGAVCVDRVWRDEDAKEEEPRHWWTMPEGYDLLPANEEVKSAVRDAVRLLLAGSHPDASPVIAVLQSLNDFVGEAP